MIETHSVLSALNVGNIMSHEIPLTSAQKHITITVVMRPPLKITQPPT